jgi:asparagine synthase (glutamine-hydrolysing)
VGFGFRRLSIIDLEGGHQPMTDSEQKICLVFNGEIYNFIELRKQLESYGHRFRTNSDTEVILHGYKQWGIDVLDHLNGMFGLAIWDEVNHRLMLARDRVGVKPLYYRLSQNQVLFGSEIRAITAYDGQKPDVEIAALNLFLRYRYTPSPLTAFKGINKLAAGTRLIIENGTPRLERWWNFRPVPFDPMPSLKEAEETLLELYRRAVKRQLISDVPVGLLLSGGLDSGLLLALMTETRSNWNAYSVGFGNGFKNNEVSRAAEVARHFESKDFAIEMTKADFENGLQRAVSAVEEPVTSDSIVPMYFLCQRARQDVKVALMGQGPDELFGGYRRHVFAAYGVYARMLPDSSQWLLRSGLNYALGKTTANRLLSSLNVKDAMTRYQNVFSQLPGPSINSLFRDGVLSTDADHEILNCWQQLTPLMEGTDDLGGLQFLELRSSLPDELLLYADKLSMASGLEIRVPYLDHEIVEYAERLSSPFKVRNGSTKWLHRQLCRRLLPSQMVGRRKIAFETPVGEWFRSSINGTSSDYLRDPQSRMYQFLRYDAVDSLFREHQTGHSHHPDLLFSLLALEAWLRTTWN